MLPMGWFSVEVGVGAGGGGGSVHYATAITVFAVAGDEEDRYKYEHKANLICSDHSPLGSFFPPDVMTGIPGSLWWGWRSGGIG